MSELEVLVREPRTVVLSSGATVEVRPMVARQWVRFARPGAEVLAAVRAGMDGQPLTAVEEVVQRIDLLYLLAAAGEPLIDAVAIATDQEPSCVAQLDPADLLELLDAVIEVNWHFFVARLLPKVQALGSKWAAQAAVEAGQRPSSA